MIKEWCCSAFDLITCVIFSGHLLLRYFIKNYGGCHVIIQIAYILKIQIRNREMYLPEVRVFSTMAPRLLINSEEEEEDI